VGSSVTLTENGRLGGLSSIRSAAASRGSVAGGEGPAAGLSFSTQTNQGGTIRLSSTASWLRGS
jgi:hypothetical protein